MIRLNQTASQLLSLITAQNGATVVVSYSDKSATGYDGNTQVTAITSATTTTICATPAASTIRDVDHISIRNTFAGSHAITLQLSSSATLYPLVSITLANGDSLEYTHGSGWQVLDSNGQTKQTFIGGSMTSAQLAGIITDETGSGSLVFATSPTLVIPTLGVASATSINKVAFTAPATGSTLTIADGKTLTQNFTGTFAGTDGTTMTFPATSASVARTDAAQTFTGTQTFGAIAPSSINGVTTDSTTNKVVTAASLVGGTLPGSFTNLNATGNAAVGVTPSTFSAAYAVQVGLGASFIGGSSFNFTDVGNNLYGNYSYLATGAACLYRQFAGEHTWLTAASGTAGNAISFTQQMLLNSSGLAVTGAISSTTTLKSGGYTVATLPAGSAGMRAYVTDATTPTWLAALTGGGAVVAPVFHNGTAWLSA